MVNNQGISDILCNFQSCVLNIVTIRLLLTKINCWVLSYKVYSPPINANIKHSYYVWLLTMFFSIFDPPIFRKSSEISKITFLVIIKWEIRQYISKLYTEGVQSKGSHKTDKPTYKHQAENRSHFRIFRAMIVIELQSNWSVSRNYLNQMSLPKSVITDFTREK